MERGLKIVVFGCDNSGKTTLCNEIKKYYSEFEVAKSIGANKTAQEYMEFMNENLTSDKHIIFDRFPIIEESVCGTVLRGKDVFDSVSGAEKSNLMSYVDLFVYCYPGLFSVLNWGDREQMDGVKQNVLELINGYNKYAKWLHDNKLNVCEYNYNANLEYANGKLREIIEIVNRAKMYREYKIATERGN